MDARETAEGSLELRARGERDFMITIAGRVLMSSTFTRSEQELARLGCAPVARSDAPRVLLGGLGLGYTLRAALDALPPTAHVEVAELSEPVVEWCRGPAAIVSGDALADPRVEVFVGDVTDRIGRVAEAAREPRFDAILLDLYVGPGPKDGSRHPLYGRKILARVHAALRPGGVFAVWGENAEPSFDRRLRGAGFEVTQKLVDGGGPRHAVFLARR